MNKLSKIFCFALVSVFFALYSAASIVLATPLTLTPDPANGNPSSVGPINNFVVSLIPDPALYMTSCPWLIPAAEAAAQPYNNSATDEWNFSYATSFNGTFNMTQYAATNNGSYGGADFEITYTAGEGDPSGNAVRWMQVIATNMPTARGQTYGVAGTGSNGIAVGTTAYLDNAGPGQTHAPIDPYYGWLTATDTSDITTSTAANSTHFLDTPWLPLVDGRLWEAQAFVVNESTSVSDNITTHDVAIYGGVWWGFRHTAVPEPSTFALLVIGIIGFVGHGLPWRCKRR